MSTTFTPYSQTNHNAREALIPIIAGICANPRTDLRSGWEIVDEANDIYRHLLNMYPEFA